MKRILLVLTAIVMVFAVMSCSTGKQTIAYIGMAGSQPFWVNVGNAAKAEAQAQKVDFIDLTSAEQNVDLQKTAFDNAILKKVSGIILGAVDSRALGDSLDKAQAAKIRVVTVDTGIEHPWISTLIQTDNLEAAKLAGDYIVKTLAGKTGKVLILGGSVGHQTGDARKNGVTEKCEAAGLTVIYRPADWDSAKAAEIAENELSANNDIVAIFGCWDPGAVAAIPALQKRDLIGKVILVGFDGLPMGLKAIKAGEMNASIAQDTNKMGKEGVDLMIKIIKGETVEKYIPIPGVVIDASNVDQFLK